jgi:hypothetical protein
LKLKQANAYRGNLSWLGNPDLEYKLQGTLRFAVNGSQTLLNDDGVFLGHKFVTSTLIPNNGGTGTNLSTVIYGNWSDLWVGHWGARTIHVDDSSAALRKYGKVAIMIQGFHDVAVARDESFVFCKDVVTA